MTQVSSVISSQYGPGEWLSLAQSDSAKAIRKATLHWFSISNGFESAELVIGMIKRGETDAYAPAKKMMDALLKDRSRTTAGLYRTQLQMLYEYCEVPFKKELFRSRVPAVKARHSVGPPDVSHDDLKAILLKASQVHLMLEPYIEFLISTGWRIEEPFQVRLRDLDLSKVPGRVRLHALTDEGELANKTGTSRESFLSSEAVRSISAHIRAHHIKKNVNGEDYLFPLDVKNKDYWAYRMIMKLLKQLGLTKREGYLEKWNFHPHTFRYINLSIAKRNDQYGQFDPDAAETLAGHEVGVQGTYRMEEWARSWVKGVEPRMRFLE